MNIDKPCHNSSCEPTATGRRSKKSSRTITDVPPRSLWHGFFWPFLLMQRDSKRICKRDRLRLLIKWRINKKKFFSFFYPHTLTFRLKRSVYRGFSGEGKCEGKLSPLTLALTPSWISLAVIRPVSLRLQNEGQKKLTDCTDAHGVFDTDFFDLRFFDA